VSVQLAAYRLAWAALAGVPVASVSAAFYYVAADLTVRPADLLDEAGLAALLDAIPAAGDPATQPARPGQAARSGQATRPGQPARSAAARRSDGRPHR
jgi:hypothetical protein